MAMNHEFERHIEAAKKEGKLKGIDVLKSMQVLYETLALAGIVPVLQKEPTRMSIKTCMKRRGLISYITPDNIDPENLSLGQAVAYFRIRRNFTQKKLGSRAGDLCQATISEIEHGNLFASDEAWGNILKALSMGGEDPAIELLERKRTEELIKRKGEK